MSTFMNGRSRRPRLTAALLAAAALVVAGASVAGAAMTPEACLAKKLKEWGSLRKCQASENAKLLAGKPSGDPTKCQTKFDIKLEALKALSVPGCRYVPVDAGPEAGTVMDYDLGLQWEQKTDDGSVHDKDDAYVWCLGTLFACTNPANLPDGDAFTAFLGTLNAGTIGFPFVATSGCFAGHCDWRLPAKPELQSIVDSGIPGCISSTGPCLDQAVFGPTNAAIHWSATTYTTTPANAWAVNFGISGAGAVRKGNAFHVRAVRSAFPVPPAVIPSFPVSYFHDGACLAKKLKEWGKLRKCQAVENGKALQGKPADPAKCQTKLDAKLAAISERAFSTGTLCRYGDNGYGMLTDYDSGLVWELKDDSGGVHDKDDTYTWTTVASGTVPDGTAFTEFLGTLNYGTSNPATPITGCFLGQCDWRLPLIEELRPLLAAPAPCPSSPCIDLTFGPTIASNYWSASSSPTSGGIYAWAVHFGSVALPTGGIAKNNAFRVRAVRSGL
jgi:hypothetical protein